jgi:hypothetical protein
MSDSNSDQPSGPGPDHIVFDAHGITTREPQWSEPVDIGGGTLVRRPLDEMAKRMCEPVVLAALALHDRLTEVEETLARLTNVIEQ